MLYNNPGSANVDVKPALIARMAESTKVTYVKESTVDVRRIHQIKRLCGDRVQVLGGYMGFESFMVGADGWVSVCANVIPGLSARMFDLWDRDRDYDGARALFEKINPIIEALGAHWYVQGTKACFDLMGSTWAGPAAAFAAAGRRARGVPPGPGRPRHADRPAAGRLRPGPARGRRGVAPRPEQPTGMRCRQIARPARE